MQFKQLLIPLLLVFLGIEIISSAFSYGIIVNIPTIGYAQATKKDVNQTQCRVVAAAHSLTVVNISGQYILDDKGEVTSMLKRGMNYTLHLTLVSSFNEHLTPFVSSTIYDSNVVPVSIATKQISLIPHEEKTITMNLKIVSYAYTGIGSIKVTVFTQNPKNGGIPFGPES